MTKDKELLINLCDLTTNKLELLSEIYNLTVKQKEFIESKDVRQLRNIIQEKHKKIERIDNIDLEFNEKFEQIKKNNNVNDISHINGLDKEQVIILQKNIKKIKEVLAITKSLDDKNIQSGKELLGKFAQEIKKISNSKKTNKAYNFGNSIKPPSYFIDQKK